MTKVFNKHEMTQLRKLNRNNMPKAEIVLWSVLKGKKLEGYKFRRQYSVENYILDFYCPEFKLGIEIDGPSHYDDDSMKKDKERTQFISNYDIKIIRFSNIDVYENLDGVCENILENIEKLKKK
eukprot:Anaeramoba_ignava/a218650_23.p5 GENE.a218650_23~~a218650_23.p5  ORF type:complete len:124 (-),score=38.09 a218650_23:578-949(-)